MGSIGEKIFKNTYYNFLANFTISISRFLSSIIIARILGPALTGVYSLVLFIYNIAEIMTNLGLGNLATKYISQFSNEDNYENIEKVFAYTVKLKFYASIAVSVLLILFSGVLSDFYREPNLKSYIIFSAIILLPESIALIFQSAIQGMQHYKAFALRSFLIAPIHIILVILVLKLHLGIEGLIITNMFMAAFDLLICYLIIKKGIHIRFEFKALLTNELRQRIFRYNWQVAMIVILDSIVWQKSEVFFLGKLSTQAQVAFYSLSYNLANWTIGFLPGIVFGVLFPAISELHGMKDRKSIEKIYMTSTRYLMMLCIPMSLVGIGLSPLLIGILYGSEYIPMAMVLNILLGSTCIGLICGPGSLVIYGMERQDIILKASIVATCINILLNFILIPKYGAVGAAFANSIAQLTAIAICTTILWKSFSIKFPVKDLLRIAMPSLIIFLVVLLITTIQGSLSGLILSICTAILMYTFFITHIKVLRVSDMSLLEVMGKKLPTVFQSGYDRVLCTLKKYAIPDSTEEE